jgi:BolA protein
LSAEVIAEIERRLAVLTPTQVDIADESERHAGHAGAASGGHYRLTLVSSV